MGGLHVTSLTATTASGTLWSEAAATFPAGTTLPAKSYRVGAEAP